MLEAYPYLTVIPPLVAIVLAIVTRRVLLSLGIGIVAAAALVTDLSPLGTLKEVWSAFAGIFWSEGALNTDKIYILLFLLILGVITALILMSGGSAALSKWAAGKIKNRKGAQFLAAILGIAIFIDDYFNALAVGQVAKPVTDKYNVSRAKLAYIIDSTSAPVAVLAPFSSWGASIIGLLAPIVVAAGINQSEVHVFLGAAGTNFYAISAILMVLLMITFGIDFGPMRTEEHRAIREGETYAATDEIPGELGDDLPVHPEGKIRSLVIPFIALIVGVVGAMFVTGGVSGGSWTVIDMLANTMVTESLMIGGLLGLASAMVLYFVETRNNKTFNSKVFGQGIVKGARSMVPAVIILLLAWSLGSLISDLGTGSYLGDLVKNANFAPQWLIPVMFIAACLMSFSTGTSWGSFGLLIPIAGDLIISVGAPQYLIPAIGAVLAGSVMGDHCSPISDTTILSATGASSSLITHVRTQLPYALTCMSASLVGYIALAASGNSWVGFFTMLVTLLAIVFVWKRMATALDEEIPDSEKAPIFA
ncbi:sodium:proton antiporter [Boudabousia liubingyangii]|uniref:Sodium:proton antiporter n=1 Tax=Boudabousia liubingyangii TaxID=1921764 RepID=A0A1Q5PLA6_9ACTO|nr:Na+/H+ antiporter NhaC family protein [Boudabousia liubingyangii]OKL47108.1 sodium:proton antiporter [Boudabousia liubingyangii]OKL47826.1 sodium:proton antiporter [Boudabousia liubingyangii]